MTNPFDSNPFEEPADSYRGRGANPFAEPSRPSGQPTPDSFAEPYAETFAEPQRAYSPAPVPDYAPAPAQTPASGGTIHRFSFVKGFFSFISVMGALGSFDSGDILFGLGFGLPGAWYFIKSIQQKTNPTEPQKRHWFVIWLIAILLVIIG